MSQRRGRGSRDAGASRAGRASGTAGGRAPGRTGGRASGGAGGKADNAGRVIGRPVGDAAAQRTRLREIIEPVVAAAGYDLDSLALSRAGRRHLVRLTIDGDRGVSLDAVAEVSRQVSAALDAIEAGGEEVFAGEYELQVSSPGVDRPLTLPRHWRRNVGRMVQVRVSDPQLPDRQLTGRVLAADDDGIVLEVAGKPHELAHDALGPGRIQIEFTRLAALSESDLEDILDPIDDDGEADDADRPAADDEREEDEE